MTGYLRLGPMALSLLLCFTFTATSFSQTFTPIPVSGFNQDVIAEAGTSSLTTTTMALDGVTVSNKVMYSNAFRIINNFTGGGLPDNGTIVNGTSTYQLAPYTGNNAVLIQRNQTGTMTLTTPAKYSAIRLLCFSTEGPSLVTALVTFTDATTTAITAFTVNDWFNNSTNLVLSGFGRCTRATPASGADAFPANPNMYFVNFPISCADRQKNIQSIQLNNVTTAGTNAPFPNAVFLAMSGVIFTQTFTPAITQATCTAGGSVTINATGVGFPPYTITYNTVPPQSGSTATNITPGSYQATVTDGANCVVTIPFSIAQPNAVTLTGNTSTAVCAGSVFTTTTTSNATNYTWTANTPANVAGISNTAIANPSLTPSQTTTYNLVASTGACSQTNSFTLTVNAVPTISPRGPLDICSPGQGALPGLTSNGTLFSWSPSIGVSNPGILNPLINPSVTTPYTVTATLGNCNASTTFTAVVSTPTANAGNAVTITQGNATTLSGTASAGTYLWTPSTGLSAVNVLNPVASPAITTTYTLQVTTGAGCTASGSVTITVVPDCFKNFDAFSPNGDGINDMWILAGAGCTKHIKALVYNRYGSPVFESTNYANDWNGTYKGKPIPDGTYYYVISFTMLTGDIIVRKGNVTLLR